MSKTVTAVYDVTVGFNIEVPDGATDDEIERIANEFLDENYGEVCDCLSDNLCDYVALKEVYA
jgi:hypothetical protein